MQISHIIQHGASCPVQENKSVIPSFRLDILTRLYLPLQINKLNYLRKWIQGEALKGSLFFIHFNLKFILKRFLNK